MYQSSHRKNFLDILIEPTSIGILLSIVLHAVVGASFPFFTQPEKENKKAEPGTVKVVELTPNELQRIPQAPLVPVPQAVVTPPVIASTPVPPPSNPPISPNSPTIPFSPIRIPLEKIKPQAPKGSKEQQPIGQPQPAAPIFDPNLSLKPARKKTKQEGKTNTVVKQVPIPKPIPKPTPKPVAKTPKVTTSDPFPGTATDDDGGDTSTTTPGTTSGTQAQNPVNTSPTGTTTNPTRPGGQSSGQPSGTPGTDSNSFPPFYGIYAERAADRIQQYLKAHPGIVLYKPATLRVSRSCSSIPKAPFIVLMTAFGEVPENKENNPLGDSTAPSIDKTSVFADQDTPENRKLSELAINAALYEANKADQNRAPADKGKKVLYQYRVEFEPPDPKTCKR